MFILLGNNYVPEVSSLHCPTYSWRNPDNPTRKTRNPPGILPQPLSTKWLLISGKFLEESWRNWTIPEILQDLDPGGLTRKNQNWSGISRKNFALDRNWTCNLLDFFFQQSRPLHYMNVCKIIKLILHIPSLTTLGFDHRQLPNAHQQHQHHPSVTHHHHFLPSPPPPPLHTMYQNVTTMQNDTTTKPPHDASTGHHITTQMPDTTMWIRQPQWVENRANANEHTKEGQRKAKKAQKEQQQDVQGTPVFNFLILF